MKAEPYSSSGGRGRGLTWRIGALFGFVVLTAVVAFGASSRSSAGASHELTSKSFPMGASAAFNAPGGGQVRAAATGPKIQTQPLGTEADCNKRLGAKAEEYCSDLFLTIGDLDSYWKEQFPKLATKNQKYTSPKGYFIGLSPVPNVDCFKNIPAAALDYCGDPAHYSFNGNTVYMAESEMLQYHQLGDFSAMIIMAHEWGHHIQNLLGGLQQVDEQTYTIQFELQADCYAGAWANYEDTNLEQLEPGDVDEASTLIYSVGDPRDGSWNDEDAHGQAEQRVLAFRTGYVFGDPRVCSDWRLFDGTKQPLLNLGKYALAITPPDEVEQADFGYVVHSGETVSAIVSPLAKLGTGSAQSQFPTVLKNDLGPTGRPLDVYKPEDLPARGRLPQSEVDKATSYAQTYELTINGKQVHGILYVSVRSGGGNGVLLDVFAQGAAGKADWKPLQTELRYLLLGLSIKNGQDFGFSRSLSSGDGQANDSDDPHNSSSSSTPSASSEDDQ